MGSARMEVEVAQQAGQVDRCLLEGELAGFDLGQVEDVVDDGQQVPGGGVDLFQAFGLFEGGGFPLHDVRHAEDGVHRRADLVAHVGEEGALGQVGGFGLEGSHLELIVQLLKLYLCSFQVRDVKKQPENTAHLIALDIGNVIGPKIRQLSPSGAGDVLRNDCTSPRSAACTKGRLF